MREVPGSNPRLSSSIFFHKMVWKFKRLHIRTPDPLCFPNAPHQYFQEFLRKNLMSSGRDSNAFILCLQTDSQGSYRFFTRRGGIRSVIAGHQFFWVPLFAYVKKFWSPFVSREKNWSFPALWAREKILVPPKGEKFWSPPLTHWKKLVPPLTTSKNSGPLHKQTPPPGKKMIAPLPSLPTHPLDL